MDFLKKTLCGLLCAVLLAAGAAATEEGDAAPAADTPVPTSSDALLPAAADGPALYGAHAALLCADNGEFLLGKDMDTAAAPASITKVMTALLVLEHCPDLSKTTTVSRTAVNSIEWNSTHIGLKEGEVVSLRDMMAALLIQSANDAANVLAEYVGGSLEEFSGMMNAKAAELGCTNTHFANAHGLDDPEHYTTAHDMALIAQAAVKDPRFTEFAGCIEYTMEATNKSEEKRTWFTKQNVLCHNPEQYFYEGAFAGKNGWTTNAHHTLVTFAKRNGVTLVAVSMGSTTKYDKVKDTIAMLDYGYDNFKTLTLSAAEQAAMVSSAFADAADPDMLRDTLVLLPKSVSADDLSLACVGGVDAPTLQVQLTADGETADLFSLPVTLMTQGAPASGAIRLPSLGLGKPGSFPVLPTLIGVASLFIVAFILLYLYRAARIRKQRRRIHDMRVREKQALEKRLQQILDQDGVDLNSLWKTDDE